MKRSEIRSGDIALLSHPSEGVEALPALGCAASKQHSADRGERNILPTAKHAGPFELRVRFGLHSQLLVRQAHQTVRRNVIRKQVECQLKALKRPRIITGQVVDVAEVRVDGGAEGIELMGARDLLNGLAGSSQNG